jgi:hypothetical protein
MLTSGDVNTTTVSHLPMPQARWAVCRSMSPAMLAAGLNPERMP